MVEITEYCNNPGEYTSLPLSTQSYYRSICTLRKSVGLWPSTKEWEQFGTFVGKDLVLAFVQGIFTPEGLQMISEFEGVLLTSELALNVMFRSIAKGLAGNLLEKAAIMAAEQGTTKFGIAFINNAIMTTVLSGAVKESVWAVRAFSTLKFLQAGANILLWWLNILMIIAFILDAWDPGGYNQMLTAEILAGYVNQFNDGFASSLLSDFVVGNDEFGNPIRGTIWPIEYYADYILNDDVLGPEKSKEYNDKSFLYNIEYLDSLKYNSLGQLICLGDKQKSLITNPMIQATGKKLSVLLSNQNTIVTNWVYRLWPILVIILILIIIFLLLIK